MSKLMMFDFICEDGHQFEDLVKPTQRKVKCPCGVTATRQVSAGHIDVLKMGLDPAFSSASDRWAKLQEQKARTDKGSLNAREKAPNLKMY